MAFFTQKKVKALLFTVAFLLLANALHQLSWKLMHFGVILPLILGAAVALLGWKLESVRAWVRRSRWRGLRFQNGLPLDCWNSCLTHFQLKCLPGSVFRPGAMSLCPVHSRIG